MLSGFWPLKNVPSIIPAFAASNGTRHSSNTSSSSIPQQCLPYLHTSPQALASAEDPTPSNTSSAPSTTSSAQSEISSTPSAVEGIVENGTIHVPVGDILGGHRREIHSPNGAYFLRLEDNGNLVLHHNLNLINGTQRLWTLSTGNIEKGFERVARLSNESVLSVFSQEKKKHTEKNGTVRHRVEEQLIWHSNLLDGCARAKVPRGGRAPALTLSSRGELSINGRCSLYTPPPPSAGKMALLVTGLYRTVQKNCENHVKYIVKNPHMEHVDVYAYMLYEPKNLEGNVTVDMLKHKVKECYGSHLADLVIRPVAEVEETYKGEPIELCGKRISRLQSQLKTLYLAGMTWWRISMTKGLRYDTVMRIRPDQQFFGDSMPFFKAANDLSSTELVMPPILAVEGTPRSFHWFCSDPFGDATMGKSFSLFSFGILADMALLKQ